MAKPGRNPLVLASENRGKLDELSGLLEPLGFDLRPQSDWQVPEAIEDATSFLENALIKARNAARHTGLGAIADDSGLIVPALGGAPGIHSARYAGRHGGDAANNEKLLQAMEGLVDSDRLAFFHCTMVYLKSADDPVPVVSAANWRGQIAGGERGSGGFGYDPLFWLSDLSCTSAELAREEKNRISHRARAARRLAQLLKEGNGV